LRPENQVPVPTTSQRISQLSSANKKSLTVPIAPSLATIA
jgi:hypothetical protein